MQFPAARRKEGVLKGLFLLFSRGGGGGEYNIVVGVQVRDEI